MKSRTCTFALVTALAVGPTQALAANAPDTEPAAGFGKDLRAGPLRVDLGAQLRLRYEYDDNLTIKSYAPGSTDGFLLERLMLDSEVRYGKSARIFVQLRDAHAFGSAFTDADFPQSNPIHDTLDIRQAFVQWRRIGGTPMGLKLGRQQISYGDQRVFGPGLWGNTGRYAWDAAMLQVETHWYDVDLWAGKPIENRPDRWPNHEVSGPTSLVGYAKIKGLPLRVDLFEAVKYDPSSAVKGESGSGPLRSYSSGFQAEGSAFDWFGYGATFVYQTGTYGRDKIRALGFQGKASAKLADAWKPRVTAQLTWGSGDKNPHDGVHGTFDGVLGGADIAFYGYLNLFYWANLHDHELDFDLAPHRTVLVRSEYHYMTLDQSTDAWYSTGLKPVRVDRSGEAGSELGHELDAKVIWKAWEGAELLVAGGHFFPGRFVRVTGKSPAANWVAAQMTYGF
jgi:hypothetical protein